MGAWLRAAVMGASDGVVSTASVVLGVAAADVSTTFTGLAGLASLVGGALSMAASEYVSVSSQRDLEHAELEIEKQALVDDPDRELDELSELLVNRGLPPDLAVEAALAFTEHDALAAHAKEELGIVIDELAKPVTAAVASAMAFSVGAAIPLLIIVLSPDSVRRPLTLAATVVALVGLGWTSAYLSRTSQTKTIARVVIGGALAMGLTTLVGHLFGMAT